VHQLVFSTHRSTINKRFEVSDIVRCTIPLKTTY